MSNKVAKWEKWIDLICHDCGNLMLSRDMFLDLHAMIKKNPRMQCPDYFHSYMSDTYVAHAIMMLRKHIKTDKDSITLTKLATDLTNNSDQAPRPPLADTTQSLHDEFLSAAKKVESFADRRIAHLDKRAPESIPTYNEIEEAIKAMDTLSIHCLHAITGNSMSTCKPTVQNGWLNVFRDMGIET